MANLEPSFSQASILFTALICRRNVSLIVQGEGSEFAQGQVLKNAKGWAAIAG